MNTWRIITPDRKQIPLNDDQVFALEAAMSAGRHFFKVDKDTTINVLRDIARVERIPAAERVTDPSRQLPRGNIKFDPNGPGYKSFQAQKAKLAKKLSIKKETE